jgi:hypothetical protein
VSVQKVAFYSRQEYQARDFSGFSGESGKLFDHLKTPIWHAPMFVREMTGARTTLILAAVCPRIPPAAIIGQEDGCPRNGCFAIPAAASPLVECRHQRAEEETRRGVLGRTAGRSTIGAARAYSGRVFLCLGRRRSLCIGGNRCARSGSWGAPLNLTYVAIPDIPSKSNCTTTLYRAKRTIRPGQLPLQL